jgi:hypothetical protein
MVRGRQYVRRQIKRDAARFQRAPLWLEERIREAVAKLAESVTLAQFGKKMKAILAGG